MLLDQISDPLPRRMRGPLSVLTALAAASGAACLCAAVAFGAYSWAYFGLGAFILSGILWQITDRLARR